LPAQAAARPAKIDDTIKDGNALRTGNDSRSEITFADLTITRLGENTVFTTSKSGRSVHLDSGTILLYAKKNSGGAEIFTKAVTVGVSGTSLIFQSRPDSYDHLTVLEGEARFSLINFPDQSTEVRAGEFLHVKAGMKKLPAPGRANLRRLMRTHPLITNFPPLPSLDLIQGVMQDQNPSAPRPRAIASRGPQSGPSPPYVRPPTPPSPRPGYPGVSPTATYSPKPTPKPIVGSTPTATIKPTPAPTPKPTPKPTPPNLGRSPKPTPKSKFTPKKKWTPPKKHPTATPTPVHII
jgi:mannose-6-phosphate isomerase-like protein (cupin superfamily)